MSNDHTFAEVAIIGLAGQFPQSNSADRFWENIRSGKEMISSFSSQELRESGIDPKFLEDPRYIKAKGVVEGIDCFDAELFGYSPQAAMIMDPQHRCLLECAWTALENSGYDPSQYQGLIGVFVGCNPSTYFLTQIYPGLSISSSNELEDLALLIGNGPDYLATRISYKLNLKGPSKTIQTACSTSLVAIHDACQSLLNYQCDIALSGGVAFSFPQKSGYFYSPESINSPDGHCRAFDQRASGTVFSDGIGLVVLKRLEDALADRDSILAVIKGSAVNNDGSDKVGFLAPSVQGQAEVIAAALASADIPAETISYIETHGTGTSLGDPIEIAALTQAFQAYTDEKQFCAIGSLKTNVGHLATAAGIAGLIKTVLMLKHREIPPTLHFEVPNPKIPFHESPFYVNTKSRPWKSSKGPLRAGVSSFGMGGTNAHVILEEASEPPSVPNSTQKLFLLPFSANTAEALKELLTSFSRHLKTTPHSLGDIAYTLQLGRKPLPFRYFVVSSSAEEASTKLETYLSSTHVPETISSSIELTKFFSNKYEIKPGTAKELYSRDAAFAKALDECCNQIQKERGEAGTRKILLGNTSKDFLEVIGSLWQLGKNINWPALHFESTFRRVPLPTYPFAKTKFWKDVASPSLPSSAHNRSLTKAERILAILWSDVLKIEEIKAEESFFLLGGDSLSALEILQQIRTVLCVEVSLNDFFAHPTIAQLAIIVENSIRKRAT